MTTGSPLMQREQGQRSFCVVIPAFNEALLISRCIQSVVDAGIAAADIYVVDDCSSDGTAAAVRAIANVNLLVNATNQGKLTSIQHITTHFRLAEQYTYFAVLDADSHVAPDYFREVLARFLESEHIVLVCGAPQSERYNSLTAYRAFEYAVTLKLYRQGQDAMGVITVAPGCASVYRTRILSQLDWNSQTLVEDMDLTVQIHRGRLGEIAYTPHAIAFTQDPRTLPDYVGQLTRWYRGTWQVMRLRGVPRGGQRIDAEFALLLAESLLFSTLTLCLPLLAWFWPSVVLRALVIDQTLALAFAIACAGKLRRVDILTSFIIFPVLRVLNCFVLVRSFWCEVIRRQHCTQWFSVRRYPASYIEPIVEIAHV
jgi:cellulose synthase/poly-beta-1,6-N-acetylglucosamine synthase-like glycosyltransferase